MSDTLLSRLARLRLPLLEYNRRRIRAALDRPATSHLVLARLVSDDPGLMSALMRRLGADPRHPEPLPASPLQIIGLLGRAAFQEILGQTPALESGYGEPVLGGLRGAYGRAIHAAAFARRLATLGGTGGVDEAPAAALLCNLLEMVLWVGRPDTATALGPAGERPDAWAARAAEALAAGTPPAAALAGQWRLPDRVRKALAAEPSEDREIRLVQLSSALSWAAHWDWYGGHTRALVEETGDLLGLAPDLLLAVLHREAAETARLMARLGLPHCMDRLVLPVDVPWRRPPAPRPGAETAAGQGTPDEAASPPPAPARPGAAPHPVRRGLSEVLRRARVELGLERAMFAMLTPDRRRLRARFVAEDEPSDLRRFDVPLDGDHLFTRILREQAALRVAPPGPGDRRPEIPAAVAALLPPGGFYAAPVLVKGQPIGILYGDGAAATRNESFAGFRHLALEAGRMLSLSATGHGRPAGARIQTTRHP